MGRVKFGDLDLFDTILEILGTDLNLFFIDAILEAI